MSMERNCTVLLHYDKNTPPNEDEIREELESKEVRARNRTPPAASNSISRPCGSHRRSLRRRRRVALARSRRRSAV